MTHNDRIQPLDLDDAPRYLRVSHVEAIAHVSGRTVRRWIALGYILSFKPAGGRVLVDRDSLRQFIEQGRI